MRRILTTRRRPALLTTSEVADVLRVSAETVRRRIADGTIRAIIIGRVIRIPSSELDRLLGDVSAAVDGEAAE